MDVTSVIDACQSNMLEKSIHRKIDATFFENYTRLFTFVIKMIENMIIGVKYVVMLLGRNYIHYRLSKIDNASDER